MNNVDQIYINLQKHLDKQAVGFPATKSGVEIRILKELFTPEQASLVLNLNYQPQSISDIFKQINDNSLALEKVKNMLEDMENNGVIGCTLKEGNEYYFTVPLLVGIAELHSHKATPKFWEDFKEYISGEFGEVFANTKVSQLRTIPVEKSIPDAHHIATYDQIRETINTTDGPIAVGKCICREGAKQRGQECHTTTRSDTCMAFGDWARHFIKQGMREITRSEALEITRLNEEDGLVLQPTNYQKIDFVCACCGCCCGVLTRLKSLPQPAKNWAHNFYAVVDNSKCVGCGICVEKCQMNAISMNDQIGCTATISSDSCIGCGNCVAFCPSKALKLVKIEKEIVPPKDSTGLYEILAERE